MVLRCVHAEYDEVKDKTKLFIEDFNVVDETFSQMQEVAPGNLTDKTRDEQLAIAKQVHRERYYADEVTSQFLEDIARAKSETAKIIKSTKNYRDLEKRVSDIEQLLAGKFGSKNEHDSNIEVE